MEMSEENIRLLKLLNGVVKLLDNCCSKNAGELFVFLADYVIKDLIWTLQVDLNPALVVFWSVVCRPQGHHCVVDECLVLPG